MTDTHPFSRILLATEHTEFDAGAERVAFAMAKRCGVPLRVVVPIASNPEYEAGMPDLALRRDRAAAEKIDALRRDAQAAGVQLDIQVRHGPDSDREIVAEANAWQADLIVLRRRGKPGFLSRRLMGEMVSKVTRDVSCCVLAVPRAAEFWSHGIVAAVGDTPEAQDISRIAATLARACDLPLTLASAAADEAALPRIESLNTLNVALASAVAEHVTGRVRIGTPAELAIAAMKETASDLIVIGRQRYHIMPFLQGGSSIMQKIIGAIDAPTLIVPTRQP